MRLYRPVGQAEYDLIAQSGFTAYPPRLPEQPIFYPVLNECYAREIAEKWNKRYPDSQYTGYVTTFEIDDGYISQFPVQTVGASYHQELWIPAEELENFNRHIIGTIAILSHKTHAVFTACVLLCWQIKPTVRQISEFVETSGFSSNAHTKTGVGI